MHKILVLYLIIFFSCGSENSTNPSTEPQYYSTDNAFITELIKSNAIELDSLENRIVTIITDGKDRIKSMDLSNLGLEILPENIKHLEYLEELNLSGNLFTNLPEELCIINQTIDNLNIDNNNLCDPTGITHCILQDITINFEKQECIKIKYEEEMDFLLEFIISNNLDSLSYNIFNDVKWSWEGTDSALTDDGKQIERIIEIKWVNYDITTIPGTISHLEFLTTLQLENNQIVTLPAEIKFLESLVGLQLHDNKLVGLPPFIGDAQNLRFIDLHNNELLSLPESLGSLNQLDFFNVGSNKLSTLPDTLCSLLNSNLQINIECNDLDEDNVPGCFKSILGSQNDDLNCLDDD